jgi:hypothetical protein
MECPLKKIIILSAILLLLLIGCNHIFTPNGSPKWVQNLIANYEKDTIGNPPRSIWEYDYNGQTVYYIPAQCCDQFSTLYDASGKVICAPDGGITGRGDGKCPGFMQERKNEKFIWEDSRTR